VCVSAELTCYDQLTILWQTADDLSPQRAPRTSRCLGRPAGASNDPRALPRECVEDGGRTGVGLTAVYGARRWSGCSHARGHRPHSRSSRWLKGPAPVPRAAAAACPRPIAARDPQVGLNQLLQSYLLPDAPTAPATSAGRTWRLVPYVTRRVKGGGVRREPRTQPASTCSFFGLRVPSRPLLRNREAGERLRPRFNSESAPRNATHRSLALQVGDILLCLTHRLPSSVIDVAVHIAPAASR
jgi:hypothetical protein